MIFDKNAGNSLSCCELDCFGLIKSKEYMAAVMILSTDISAHISTDMWVDMLTNTSRSIYRVSVG